MGTDTHRHTDAQIKTHILTPPDTHTHTHTHMYLAPISKPTLSLYTKLLGYPLYGYGPGYAG